MKPSRIRSSSPRLHLHRDYSFAAKQRSTDIEGTPALWSPDRRSQAAPDCAEPVTSLTPEPPQIQKLRPISTFQMNGILLSPTQSNGVRRTSGGNYRSPSPSPQNNGQNAPPSPLSPSTNNGETWSSAVGHATTSGKSGRVIEKLMTENDKLKRELKEQQIKAEELQRNVQMYQPRIEALATENDNLGHARDVDQTLLARRDRQNTELKAELEAEKTKREMFEQRAHQLQTERDGAQEEKRREVHRLVEEMTMHKVQAETISKSYSQDMVSNTTRIAALTKAMDQMRNDKLDAHDRLAKMDVVSNQIAQEFERTKKLNAEMLAKCEEMQATYQQCKADLERESFAENDKVRKLSSEMDKVVKDMRWVMNVKQNTKFGNIDSNAT